MPRIFLSYRRDDSAFAAHAIYERVKELFGEESITFDVNFSLGIDFAKKIEDSVSGCDILLAIIGDRWLDIRFHDGPMQGQRRLDDPNDWVRLEIASALKKDILVIPLFVGKVSMPEIAPGLPPDLADLTKKVALSVRTGPDLPSDLQLLVRGVKRAIRLLPLTPADLALPPGVKVVPQGLRSFNEKDIDFFVHLLPGPYQVDGLPERLCFWKTRIEAVDPHTTFRVGLIYGPSGCGKSSLMRAGLLPRLGGHVTVVFVEAAASGTEARLLAALKKSCPYLAGESTLQAALKRKDQIPVNQKVLIVMDQFEQYLHATAEDDQDELAEALRECDGGKLQAILMVRDDFLTPVTRFMKQLDITLAQDHNLALVDLFDRRHAKKVLALLGQAYGGLPKSGNLRKEQDAFLNQAIAELAEGDHVISVRLALFAQMFKGKEWKPATLKAIGGVTGVGVAFLEESFIAATAPEENRRHQAAAQRVLGALLPEAGTSIKGASRTKAELLAQSGYARRPEQFSELLDILDKKLRLVTPADPVIQSGDGQTEQSADSERRYQLTHDYLVPSLRDWLTSKRKETRRGRAELRLAERSEFWSVKPENRYLPSLWEFLNILLLTDRNHWTGQQQKMMGNAGRVHGIRAGIAAALLLVAVAAGMGVRHAVVEKHNATRAEGLVNALVNADIAQVPSLVGSLAQYRSWADPLLKAQLEQLGQPDSREQEIGNKRLNVALALLPVDANQVEYLYARLLDATPSEVLVLRDALAGHKNDIVEKLWTVVEQPALGHVPQRLRAAGALAAYDPEDPRWGKVQDQIADDLVAVHALHLAAWMDALRAVRGKLLPRLSTVFQDARRSETERSLATEILADYAAGRADVLANLVMDADERQFPIIYRNVEECGAEAVPYLEREVDKAPPAGATDSAREVLAQRQANAAVALVKLNQPGKAWPLLQHSPDPAARSYDPRTRTYLIHRLAPLGVAAASLVRRIGVEADVSSRRALILSLGEFNTTQFPAADRQPLIARLLDWYRNDPDPGLHAAAEWLLRQKGWDQEGELAKIDDQLKSDEQRPQAAGTVYSANNKRQWYVNHQGQTFVILHADKPFHMGSPLDEPDRLEDEIPHQERIGRTFAIASKVVTKAQFRHFLQDIPDVRKQYDGLRREIEEYSRSDDSPQVDVNWYEAARYCNWLSENEKLPKAQWCYEPNAEGKYAEGMKPAADYLQRSGYRLPTEAEWEYACRSDSQTSRYYGLSVTLLTKYAWTQDNSEKRAWPVGMKKPNDFGLFDMHGDAWQWCDSGYAKYAMGSEGIAIDDAGNSAAVVDKASRVLRGGSFYFPAPIVRSAYRRRVVPPDRLYSLGFRAARTCP